MTQPPGFKHNLHTNFVCKLSKAIYGLHQAPRAWHEALKSFVTSLVFGPAAVILLYLSIDKGKFKLIF